MANRLKKLFTPLDLIEQGKTINSWHVSQTVDAFTGAEEYDISILGSLSVKGKMFLDLTLPDNSFIQNQSAKLLAVNPVTNEVYITNSLTNIFPLQINIATRTAWNSGKGDLNNNTNFGYSSFTRNISGDGNTIYGAGNMNKSTVGFSNSIFGLQNATAGNVYNTLAFGTQVLHNSEGSDNLGFGVKTLFYLKNGVDNIGLGNYALHNSINGKNNLSIGNYSSVLNKGNNNVTLGHYALSFDELGSNRVTIGSFSGRKIGDGWLEIHSYTNEDDENDPLILGHFFEKWLKINGNLRLDLLSNPAASNISITPHQLLFDNNGKSYIMPRGYIRSEADNIFQIKGNYVTLEYLEENYYDNDEVDDKFFQDGRESLTSILTPELNGNILSIFYNGENGVIQQQNIDLSGLATIDIHINDAKYNTSTNILTLTDNAGNEYSVDLSEFSIITTTDSNGVTTLTQEEVTKLIISKVGQTGNYNDLLNKPVIPPPVDISGKLDKPTVDGDWVVTKVGNTFSYTSAANFGQNISNTNLTWTADRTQNLNSKKLTFTDGRFSVPTLEMEVSTATTIADKIWIDSSQLWHTDSSGINRKVAYDNNDILRTNQIEVSINTTAQENWKGKIILVTNTSTITIPATISNDWGCEIATLSGVTLTMAITTPKTWLFGTPPTVSERSIFTVVHRGMTNSIMIFGL